MAIPTPYSYRQYTGDGTAKDFSVPFPYLQRDHVHVYLDGKELKDGTDYNWTSGTQLKLNVAPQAAVTGAAPKPAEVLTVRRITPEDDQIVQWRDGSYIIADDLNESDKQWLYLIQEHHDDLVLLLNGVPNPPGGGGSSLPLSYWNQLPRSKDPNKGLATEVADTIAKLDQLLGDWPKDGKDQFIATSDAISARLDPYVQDTTPAPMGLPQKEQHGKEWFDTDDLVQRFWDADAGAWVTLANTGPVGPQGPKGDPGTYATIVQELAPTVRVDGTPIKPGDCWFRTSNAQLYAWYDDGTSKQWVSISKTGPKGDQGIQGIQGIQGPIGLTGPQGPTGAGSVVPGPQGPAGPVGPKGADSTVPGPVGPAGPTGPAGPAGTTGAKGDKGDTGAAGAAAGFGAPTISMLAPSATPTVAASGPDTAKVFAFGVPKGDPTRVTSADAPPANPVVGDLWFNTAKGQLYCWYDDGSSKQWVSISKTGPAAAIATATTVGTVKPGTNLTVTADGTLNAQVPGALTYQGTTDATAAPPATPVRDGLYINTKAGTVNAGFTGVTGTVAVGDWFLWDGTSWDHVGAGAATGVSSITVTAPITKTGTATAPTLGIAAATTAAAGSLSAADKTKLDGLVVATTVPLMDGTAAVGTATTWTRSDHVHPTDTSRAAEAPDGTAGTTVQYVRQVASAGGVNTKTWERLPTFAVTMSPTPPATPFSGQTWFNTNKGILYVWYVDGSSNQWVSVMGSKAR
jgi:hypothetical protein